MSCGGKSDDPPRSVPEPWGPGFTFLKSRRIIEFSPRYGDTASGIFFQIDIDKGCLLFGKMRRESYSRDCENNGEVWDTTRCSYKTVTLVTPPMFNPSYASGMYTAASIYIIPAYEGCGLGSCYKFTEAKKEPKDSADRKHSKSKPGERKFKKSAFLKPKTTGLEEQEKKKGKHAVYRTVLSFSYGADFVDTGRALLEANQSLNNSSLYKDTRDSLCALRVNMTRWLEGQPLFISERIDGHAHHRYDVCVTCGVAGIMYDEHTGCIVVARSSTNTTYRELYRSQQFQRAASQDQDQGDVHTGVIPYRKIIHSGPFTDIGGGHSVYGRVGMAKSKGKMAKDAYDMLVHVDNQMRLDFTPGKSLDGKIGYGWLGLMITNCRFGALQSIVHSAPDEELGVAFKLPRPERSDGYEVCQAHLRKLLGVSFTSDNDAAHVHGDKWNELVGLEFSCYADFDAAKFETEEKGAVVMTSAGMRAYPCGTLIRPCRPWFAHVLHGTKCNGEDIAALHAGIEFKFCTDRCLAYWHMNTRADLASARSQMLRDIEETGEGQFFFQIIVHGMRLRHFIAPVCAQTVKDSMKALLIQRMYGPPWQSIVTLLKMKIFTSEIRSHFERRLGAFQDVQAKKDSAIRRQNEKTLHCKELKLRVEIEKAEIERGKQQFQADKERLGAEKRELQKEVERRRKEEKKRALRLARDAKAREAAAARDAQEAEERAKRAAAAAEAEARRLRQPRGAIVAIKKADPNKGGSAAAAHPSLAEAMDRDPNVAKDTTQQEYLSAHSKGVLQCTSALKERLDECLRRCHSTTGALRAHLAEDEPQLQSTLKRLGEMARKLIKKCKGAPSDNYEPWFCALRNLSRFHDGAVKDVMALEEKMKPKYRVWYIKIPPEDGPSNWNALNDPQHKLLVPTLPHRNSDPHGLSTVCELCSAVSGNAHAGGEGVAFKIINADGKQCVYCHVCVMFNPAFESEAPELHQLLLSELTAK